MKKSTKGLMSALLLFAMCGTGCGGNTSTSSVTPSTPTSSSSVVIEAVATDLLKEVKDGGDGVYEVTNADGKTTVAFNKTDIDLHAWSAAKVDLTNLAHKGQMRTLKFKISGQGAMTLKLEGTKGSYEVKFTLTSEVAAYELNLSDFGEFNEKMTEISTLLFFAQPGKVGSGTFVLDELTITPDMATENGYFLINDGWTNIKEGSNIYDGVSDTFSFNRNWVDNDGNVHEFDYTDAGTVVTYTKSGTYQFASTEVSGEYGKFEYINFIVQGAAGDSVLFKVEGSGKAKETIIHFDGTVQTHTLDLTEFSQADRQGFNKVLMFAAPGNDSATGTYTVVDAYYAHTWDGSNRVYPTSTYDGSAVSNFNINAYWHDGGDNVYTVDTEASPFEVTYTNVNAYSSLKTKISGKFGNFTKLSFGLELPVGKKALVKLEGKDRAAELTVDGTGNCAGFEIDLTSLTPEKRNSFTQALIFVEPEISGVSGKFVIHWMHFDGFKSQENEYISGEEFNVNANWQGDALYNITEADGKTTIAWEDATPDNRWTQVRTPLKGDLSVFGELQYNVLIPAGTSTLVKLDGIHVELGFFNNIAGNEAKEFKGYFDLSTLSDEQMKNITAVIFFPIACDDNTTQPASGTIEVRELKFVRARTTVAEDGSVDIKNASWFGGAPFSSEVTEDGVNISYTTGSWDTYKFRIAPTNGYSKVVVEFTGIEGRGAILKLETEAIYSDAEAKFLNEDWNPNDKGFLTGEKQTVEFDISKLTPDQVVKFMVFAEPTQANPAGGNIVIHSVTFVK